MGRIDVLGVGFDDFTNESAVALAYEKIKSGEKTYVVTPNPEIVWLTRKDDKLRTVLNDAGLVLADGIGIVIGAKILGTPLNGGRVPGIDFISLLFEKLATTGARVFLLGAKPGVAQIAGKKLAEKYSGLVISATSDGYFTDVTALIEEINASSSDLLLVCLGAPKQEFWMSENLDLLNVPLCAGLGGSLDVFAGNVKRAPVFFRRLGLEWLYRIIKEPKRIKRSLSLPLFLLRVIFKKISGK